jgi:hypothetical protein
MSAAMSSIATWMFLPSLALTLIAGLLAIAVNRAFHNAGWAWAKLATSFSAERNSLWVLLAVATANVVLGVWRPRLTRLPD